MTIRLGAAGAASDVLLQEEAAAMQSQISRASIVRIVDMARFAPSGNNGQPWHFLWNQKEQLLRIEFIPERAQHILDNGFHSSLISLGALLESIVIGATAECLCVRFDLSGIQENSPEHIIVSFAPYSAVPDPLAFALKSRCTDRRPYRGGNFDAAELRVAQEQFKSCLGAQQRFAAASAPAIVRYVAKSECLRCDLASSEDDSLYWLHLGKRESCPKDGIPWQALGLNLFEKHGLSLLTMPLLKNILRPFIHAYMERKTSALLQSSAALSCISVRDGSVQSIIDAGRLLLRTWCYLNQHGYGVQPMMASSLNIFDLETGTLPAERQDWKQFFTSGGEIVRRHFGIPSGEIPLIIYRTGRTSPLPEAMRCRRQGVSELLDLISSEVAPRRREDSGITIQFSDSAPDPLITKAPGSS